MAKFLFVYRQSSAQASEQPSPEQMQAKMAEWGEWMGRVGTLLVDGGDGLLPTGRIVRGNTAVTDGPFIEAKELVGGYSILQAEDYDQVIEHAQTCPVVKEGGSVEIRELAGFADM